MEPRPTLTREVEPPQRSNSGLGVMLVASAAMFFAIASSAFVLRARAMRSHCANQPATPVARPVTAPAAPGDTPACGEPITRIHTDGSRTVTYTSCSPNTVVIVDGDETAFATPLPDDLDLR